MTQYMSFADSVGHSDSKRAIFIGDDEPMLKVVTLSIHLRWPDVSPIVATNGADGVELIERVSPDITFVATHHPDMSPAALVEEVRSFSGVPLIVLSRSGDEIEAVTALELGADDYIRFPCGMMEIMARMWSSLRRAGVITCTNENGRPMVSGDLLINPATYEVFMSDRKLALTVTEFRLLHLLARNRGTVVSFHALERWLWGDRAFSPQVAKKYIQRLRSKLGDSASNPNWIASVHGVGYRFIGPKPCAQAAPD